MADIDIERKRPAVWPWLIALIAAVAVVWLWVAAADNEPTEATTAETRPSDDTPIGAAGVPTTPVREYLQFSGVATGGEVPPPMGRDHAYTAEGIRKLDAALASLVEQKRDSDARAPLDGFQDVAERIQKDPTSTEHAGQVRDAFTRAVEVLASLDAAASTGQLRSIVESIDADRPLLEQRDQVQSFFREAGRVIQTTTKRQG